MTRFFLAPSTRLSMLEVFAVSPEERKMLLALFEQLSTAQEAFDSFVGQEATPATIFRPLDIPQEDP